MFVYAVNLPVFNFIFFSDCLHCIFMLLQLVIRCRCSLRFFRSFFLNVVTLQLSTFRLLFGPGKNRNPWKSNKIAHSYACCYFVNSGD